MIYIKNIRQMSSEYDENWLIVRSCKTVPNNSKQVMDLSPSTQLFYNYLNAKNAGNFNANWFAEHYVPQFIQDIKYYPNSVALLAELYELSKIKDIALYCFCPDETLCHRSIIAGILLGSGADIECNPDYIKYWHMYQLA